MRINLDKKVHVVADIESLKTAIFSPGFCESSSNVCIHYTVESDIVAKSAEVCRMSKTNVTVKLT